MPIDHSSKQYDMALEDIRSNVLAMGGLVESQFHYAIDSFNKGNTVRADQIIKLDSQVNQLELKIDDACTHLIVRRQPAANDLRAVMASIKITTDLERIGDEAVKIARTAMTINDRAFATITHQDTIRSIADNASNILHDALDAFARGDVEQARRILTLDKVIDHEFRSILRTMVTFMMEDPRTISIALDVIWVAKAIERIGDHAKNIAEYVIYVVEGKDIRHMDDAMPDSANLS